MVHHLSSSSYYLYFDFYNFAYIISLHKITSLIIIYLLSVSTDTNTFFLQVDTFHTNHKCQLSSQSSVFKFPTQLLEGRVKSPQKFEGYSVLRTIFTLRHQSIKFFQPRPLTSLAFDLIRQSKVGSKIRQGLFMFFEYRNDQSAQLTRLRLTKSEPVILHCTIKKIVRANRLTRRVPR